ncbi:MAG: hypothetical protein ABIP94_03360 [Planctomycetota bacterium]
MRFLSTIQEPDGSTAEAEVEAPDAQGLQDLLHRQGRLLVRVRSLADESEQSALDFALSPRRRLLLLKQALEEALDAGVPLLATFRAIG